MQSQNQNALEGGPNGLRMRVMRLVHWHYIDGHTTAKIAFSNSSYENLKFKDKLGIKGLADLKVKDESH